MINLERTMEHRWIIDKNVNSPDILSNFATVAQDATSGFRVEDILDSTGSDGFYQSRREGAEIITAGVRLLQVCFYMFGYSFNTDRGVKLFMPSPMTQNIRSTDDVQVKARNFLVNLFCLQYPNPFNRTPACFDLYFGRLIVKLLTERRIQCRLYIDECIWFLPFIEKITPEIYDELVDSIVEFRSLSYTQKWELIRAVPDYNYLFANVTHEMNYYFLRFFQNAGVFEILEDVRHNDGNLFSFRHGSGNTYRNDAYQTRRRTSGYVKLAPSVLSAAERLVDRFSIFDEPTKESSPDILSRRDWLTNLYEIEPLLYLNHVQTNVDNRSRVSAIVNSMIHASKYGSRDGREFESALEPFMQLFRETRNVEIIAGAGNTDLLCAMEDMETSDIYKMNVEAKTRGGALEEVNPIRITNHIRRHGAKFCVIVAPRFASGVKTDIQNFQIVTVRSEDLGAYCYRECSTSADGHADFTAILDIINHNQGKDITAQIRDLTVARYGMGVR